MSVHAFYRLAVWVPVVVPTLVVILHHGLGYRASAQGLRTFVVWMLMIFLYGLPAYVPLALWATFWIGRQSEARIRRMAMRAPLLMATAFLVLSSYVGVVSRSLEVFLAYSALGVIMSLAIGYIYVGIIAAVRLALGRLGCVAVPTS